MFLLIEHFSSHMDVNAIIYCGDDMDHKKLIETNASLNVKRVIQFTTQDWSKDHHQSPYHILKCQETKTTWHPIGV